MDDYKRADELARHETFDVLKSALFQALEADLSERKWPNQSRIAFSEAETMVEQLIREANG